MRPFTLDIDPANTDTDGLADNNDSSGSSLTLDGALTSGGTFTSSDGLGRRIQFTDTSTTDQSGATFTVIGTNNNDEAITEDRSGPGSGATVTTTKYFKTVSAINITSGAGSATVDVGTADECEAFVALNHRATEDTGVQTTVTGTIDYDIQVTYKNILGDGFDSGDWDVVTAFDGKTANVRNTLPKQAVAMRVVVNSFTDTAEIQVHVVPH